MVEALLAASAAAWLVVLARDQRRQTGPQTVNLQSADDGEDLPCPWCYGPTSDGDSRCPHCRRNFG